MDSKNCQAYELIQKEKLINLDGMGYLLRHKKTKAQVVVIENEDNNKVFNIGFRTPPHDSTGVAHIIEHTVLCGSEKFPVKDPFNELLKGSLNTFLNAMTYPDKTVYPVASCNDKDFQNLMNVYLDAVFYPRIYKEEKIFRQEGWHYELEDVDAPIVYNGVVFNEMKGVFSSPTQVLERDILHSLFPDTAYGVESGGDPVEIPALTYEDYLDFHRKYYHPSNSYIYLYGDMNMEEKLNWLDENYLSEFEYLEVDSKICKQEAFSGMQEKYGFYSATEGEDVEGKTYFSYNTVCGDSLDPALYQAFQVIRHVLVTSVGAPLKQALLDKGIGNDISASYEESIYQPVFSIVAKNVKNEQKQEFLDTIKETLTRLVEEGLNEKSLQAALNAMEFQYREGDFGQWPKGLMYGLQIFDSWLYDEEKPFIHIQTNDTFAFLREQIGTGYYEDIIRKYLIDNPHATFVSVEPKVGLTALMEQEEAEKLAAYKESLSEEERKELVKATEELKEYQETPNTPEELACIPLLTREDMEKKAKPFCNEERMIDGCRVLYHDVFTNDINYLRFSFDADDLKEYAPYLSLLTELISSVDTDRYDKLELSDEILLHAGNFSVNTGVYDCRKSGGYRLRMEVSTKVLYKETGYMMGLIKEILTTSHLDDKKRLKEVIGEIRSAKQAGLPSAGHSTTVRRAMAYFDEADFCADQMRGIGYYDFLCDIDDHFEERADELIALLQNLTKHIFTEERLLADITADEEGYREWEAHLTTLTKGIPQKEESELPAPFWKEEKYTKNEGFKFAGKVQFVARVGSFKDKGISYHGSMRVAKTAMSYDYLYNAVRVRGGAYGVMCLLEREGTAYMVSYRDPNLKETNQVYEKTVEYLRSFEADESDMVRYIIGTISDMDIPLTPRTTGARSYSAYLSEVTEEDVQREREEVLSATKEDISRAADAVEAVLSDNYICVLGSEAKIEQEKELFDTIRVLK